MADKKDKDILRDKNLKNKGYRVIRIVNSDIDKNFEGVCNNIDSVVEKLLPPSV